MPEFEIAGNDPEIEFLKINQNANSAYLFVCCKIKKPQ